MDKFKIKKKKPVGRRNAELFCLCILIPAFVHFIVFNVMMNFNSVLLAFKYYDPKFGENGAQRFYEISKIFTNFIRFFDELFVDSKTSHYFINGMIFQLVDIAAIPVSLMIAYCIYKKFPMTAFYMVVMFLPGILSGMITALGFKCFVNSGLANTWEYLLNKPRNEFTAPLLTDNAFWILSLYKFYYAMPGALLVNVGTMRKIPEELIEYGKLEGMSYAEEFVYVVLPMMFGLIQISCLGMFAGFLTEAGPLFAVYGTGQDVPNSTITFGYYMQASILGSNLTGSAPDYMYGYSTAVNLTIGLVTVPIVWGTKKLFDLFDPEVEY